MRLFAYLFIIFAFSLSPLAAHAGILADYVVVDKSDSKLYLMYRGNIIRSFPAAFGFNPVGHKQYEGDGRTPEGHYMLDFKNDNSKFYRSIRVSYPNEQDIFIASQKAMDPGGDIFIHGQKNGHSWEELVSKTYNWTEGCIAVRDEHMDQIWQMIELETPILIRP